MELSLMTFVLMAMVVVVTPGPTVLLALSNGSKYGFSRAAYGVFGAALSDGVLIAVAAFGLGALLTASAFWFTVLKLIGVAYLIWIGVQMLRSSASLGSAPHQMAGTGVGASGGALSIFRKSFLAAVTNPKGYMFFTAFLPQFLNASDPILPQYVTLALIFIAVDVAVMLTYAGLGAKAIRFPTDRGASWIDRTCGSFLVVLGLALASVRRSEV